MKQINSPSHEQLTKELQKARREFSILYEVSNAMHTTLDLNHILYIILTGVTSHSGLGFNRAILFLLNPQKHHLEARLAIGPESKEQAHRIWDYIAESNQHLDDLIKFDKIPKYIYESNLYQSIKELRIPLTRHPSEKNNQTHNRKSLLKDAFYTGTPLHIEKAEMQKHKNDILLKKFKTNELVIMPLKAKNKVNGLIVADNLFTQKSIIEDDLKIFTMLANQAGLAIENSQLYELLIQKSHLDSLTNLWNHGFFQGQLEKELAATTDTNSSLSLLMIDIDNFKRINDTYGHQYGDSILKEITRILKDSSRDDDYACRYGGEEFSIILTQTGKDQAEAIAERIRKRVQNHFFPKTACGKNPKVTISIGLACFPLDANTKINLIQKADKAMYSAKFSGKNQIYIAD